MISYLGYRPLHKDLQYIQADMYKYPDDSLQNNLQTLHTCMDLHNFHCGMLKLWDTQDQLDTHIVCILCEDQDLVYIQVGKYKQLDDSLLSILHSHHIFPMGKGLHTLGLYRPVLGDIQSHSYIQLKENNEKHKYFLPFPNS